MDIVFKCLQDGIRYYSVRLHGQERFVGSSEECERYIGINACKVREQREEDRRPRRSRPVSVRTYRQVRTTA